jgi:ubiquinol-cytochrome c reductase cytochrome b subunit
VHFVLPFIVLGVLVLHLTLLHQSGRTSALYSVSGLEKVSFYPYYWSKDAVNVIWCMAFVVFLLLFPYSLGEVELFEEANFLNSPVHIIPEWYFLVSYAILRRVPSKGLGVLIIVGRLMVFFLYPLSANYITPPRGVSHTGLWVELFSAQVSLSYLGLSPIREPFIRLSLVLTLMYFTYHLLLIGLNVLTFNCFNL